jgi:hypothetical protein
MVDRAAILENREVLIVAGAKASVGEDNTVPPRGRVAGSLAAPLDPRDSGSTAVRTARRRDDGPE